MRSWSPLIALLALAGVGVAQNVSAKDLRELLSAGVKRFGNDGKLVVTWTLRKQEEEKAFKTEGNPDGARITDRGLEISGDGEDGVRFSLREIYLEAPSRIAFDLELASSESGLVVEFGDAQDAHFATHCFLNARIYSNAQRRFSGSFRVRGEKVQFEEEYPESYLPERKWIRIQLGVDGGELTVKAGGETVWVDRGFGHTGFSFSFRSRDGMATVRSLEIDSQVSVASVRKLYGSGKAAEQAEEVSAERARRGALAAALREAAEDRRPLSAACRSEIMSLAPSARDRLHRALGRLNEGVTDSAQAFRGIRDENPEVPVLNYFLARAFHEVDDALNAERFYEKAVALRDAYPEAWLHLGIVCAQRGAGDKADACFKKAGELDPKDPWVHVHHARALMLRGRLEEAEAQVAAALEKRPRSKAIGLLAEDIRRLRSRPAWKKTYSRKNSHYIVESSISDKLCAEMARRLLHYRRFLESALPLPKHEKSPAQVWIFDSEEEYLLFCDTLDRRLEHTHGVYHPAIKTLLLVGRLSQGQTQDTLFHEAFHQYLDLAVSCAPMWFNEGLAEYFAATTFDRSWKPTEGLVQPGRLANLQSRQREKGLIPFAEIMNMGQEEFMGPDAAIHYAQSWAMVHFFRQSGEAGGRILFDDYTKAIFEGCSAPEAFGATFGEDRERLQSLERAFALYVRKLRS